MNDDKYAHLDDAQRSKIREITADIMAAGDGGDNQQTVEQSLDVMSDWTIEEMLDYAQVDDWSTRIDFDPETGEAWEDD